MLCQVFALDTALLSSFKLLRPVARLAFIHIHALVGRGDVSDLSMSRCPLQVLSHRLPQGNTLMIVP